MGKTSVEETFSAALDALIDQVKTDRSVLAAMLCGSLSHDTVWTKSDIDLFLVTIDDKKIESTSLSLYSNGVNVHACLMPRSEFRQTVEGEAQNSFMHSLLAKGRLLYTHDESIADLCARLPAIGERDTQLQLLALRRPAPFRLFTRPTSGSSPEATSITPHFGFSMPRRLSPGSRCLAGRHLWPTAK